MLEILTALGELAPLVESIIAALEKARAEGRHAQAIADLAEGFHYVSQTGDSSQLERAIRAHLADDSGLRDNVAPVGG